jgi:hypothetical protein
MFGIKIVTKKGMAQIESNAKNQAIIELVELFKKKDKIFIEPVTLIGDNQNISNCAFLIVNGVGVTIMPPNNACNRPAFGSGGLRESDKSAGG